MRWSAERGLNNGPRKKKQAMPELSVPSSDNPSPHADSDYSDVYIGKPISTSHAERADFLAAVLERTAAGEKRVTMNASTARHIAWVLLALAQGNAKTERKLQQLQCCEKRIVEQRRANRLLQTTYVEIIGYYHRAERGKRSIEDNLDKALEQRDTYRDAVLLFAKKYGHPDDPLLSAAVTLAAMDGEVAG